MKTEYFQAKTSIGENITRKLLARVLAMGEKEAARKGRRIKIMEVCGTHTVSFSRSGIASLLEDVIELRSGPGCPICVTHQQDLDRMLSLARLKDVIIVTFGDLLRVPGSLTTLEREKASGAEVYICYSPLEALEPAVRFPQKEVVLLGVGFETTAPAIGTVLREAAKQKLTNISIYSTLKIVPPALEALFTGCHTELDALILPGHVSTVLGRKAFAFIAERFGLPAVIAGFEPLDLLVGLFHALQCLHEDKANVYNAYTHVVKEEGNRLAMDIINNCFVRDEVLWRGFGAIPGSGLSIAPPFASFDASKKFGVALQDTPAEAYQGCRCGEIITGKLAPPDCPFFGKNCSPLTPIGPCMVSSEGACGAYFQYRGGY
ncbi:MAG: hydrogenase formation protein HypD [Bacillota bacterium]